jgi:spore maturation protein CgeB
MSAFLEPNLRALAARDPALAELVRATAPLADRPVAAPTGDPTLTADGVLLHNARDPRRDGVRWATSQRERLEPLGPRATAVVLGLALGWHVEALLAAWGGPVVVVEPDLALVRTACEARDLTGVLSRVMLLREAPGADVLDAWGAFALCPHAPSLLRGGEALRAARERLGTRALLAGLRLRILVVSPVAGGSYPITFYCARALGELGHDVRVLDLAPFAAGMDALPRFSDKAAACKLVQSAFGRFLATGIVAAVESAQPDLVLFMAQAPVDAALLHEVGQRGALRAFWFVEDHRLFPYWREVAPACDHFFVIQQGEFLDGLRRTTGGRTHYLPLAADPSVHRPLALSAAERAEWGAPVGFVGAGYRNRRLAFRPLLEQGLRIWGTEWGGAGIVEAAVQRGGARIGTEDSVRIFNATTVNLNLHSSTWVDGVDPRGDFVNPRTFELAACGAFQLTDTRALLPSCFEPGREIVTFDDAAALPDLVREWLAKPAARMAVAAAARQRVLAEHTYRHRMTTLLETVCAADAERLRARPRRPTTGDVARAEGDSPLGRFLRTVPAATPFTLDGLVQRLLRREGELSEAEQILLFLHQFDDLYVREART